MHLITANKAKRDGFTKCTLTQSEPANYFVYDTEDEKTAILVQNTDSVTINVTVKAGNGIRSSIGDLSVDVPAGTTGIIGPLDSMRFKNMVTGKVTIVITSGSVILNPIAL